jgi:uncharacterized membrane protein
MNVVVRKMVFFLLSVVMISGMISTPALAANQSFTGIVGDAMCGAKHVMPGDDASCTRGCISKGSKYALIVGDKVYPLDITDKTVLEMLDKRAGEKVTIIGTEKDNTITVTSVKAAK